MPSEAFRLNFNVTHIKNFTNTTSLNSTDVFAGKRTELLVWSVIMGSVTFFGAIVNILVLISAWPQPNRKSSFGLLICHFVSLNLTMCLFNIPTYVFMIRARIDGRVVAPNTCHFVQSIFSVTAALINWSDAGMAFNRTIALFFPLHYRAFTTRPANVAIIGVAWIASWLGVMIGPMFVGFSPVMRLSTPGFCSFSPTAAGGIGGPVSMALLTIAPYSTTGLGAILILAKSSYITHRAVTHIRPNRATDGPSRALQYRLKMARMLLFTFLWTATCSAPGYIGVYAFPKQLLAMPVSALWFRISQPFQYGLTPCILLMSNDEYRKRLARIVWPDTRSRFVRPPISNTACAPRSGHETTSMHMLESQRDV